MEKLKQLKVGDYYKKQSPDADIVGKDATLPEIIRALLKYKSCRSVFVVDESNTLCGIVTARNLIRILGKSYGSDFEIPRLAEILAQTADDFLIPEKWVSPDDTIEHALKLAARSGLEDLPVIEDDQIVGVIDCFELLDWACE